MKKMLIALSLSTALFGAAPLYAEEAAAPAANCALVAKKSKILTGENKNGKTLI